MARRKKGEAVDGVVLLDKPYEVSSNHALQRVRRCLNARKAGHTGSLDPLATGLLPICLGEATKLSSYLLSADKRYEVIADLSGETTTGDSEGTITETTTVGPPDGTTLQALIAGFVGAQTQVPPMYSALKVDGRPLYAYAREGRTIARDPRPITVYAIELLSVDARRLRLAVSVSGGTYVRTLVEDIARAWGGRAHVSALRRTGVASLGHDSEMTPMDVIESAAASPPIESCPWLLPVSSLMTAWPRVGLDADEARRIGQGQHLTGDWPAGETIRLDDEAGRVLGLGRIAADGRLAPQRLFSRPMI